MEKKKNKDWLIEIGIFLETIAASGMGCLLLGNNLYETVRIILFMAIMSGVTVFTIEQSKILNLFYLIIKSIYGGFRYFI